MNRIETLDGLRGFAVLMVLYEHLPRIQGGLLAKAFNFIPAAFGFGYLGVDIFFVLSGFLITRILLNEKQKEQFSFINFYAKRALRIFPAYYLVILLVGLIFGWSNLWPVALYYANYFFAFHQEGHPLRHTWSLSVEEHFYLLWPLVIYGFSLKYSRRIILFGFPALALISALLTFSIFNRSRASELLHKGTTYRMLPLALGSYMAFREFDLVQLHRRIIFRCFIACLIIYACGIFVPFLYRTVAMKTWSDFIFLTPVSCFILLSSIWIDSHRSRIRGILNNAPVRYVGKISYGVYLFHLPIYYFFDIGPSQVHNVSQPLSSIFLPLAFCIIIPTASYYLFEAQFLRLKKRFSLRSQNGESGFS